MAGVVKSFNVSFEYALYEMSFANVMMYCSTLPTYDGKAHSGAVAVNADDPSNNYILDKIIRNQ